MILDDNSKGLHIYAEGALYSNHCWFNASKMIVLLEPVVILFSVLIFFSKARVYMQDNTSQSPTTSKMKYKRKEINLC